MLSEKSTLPQAWEPEARPKSRRSRIPTVVLFSILALLVYSSTSSFSFPSISKPCHKHMSTAKALEAAKCPAQPKSINVGNNWNPLDDAEFASLAAKRLSEAVQHNTVSTDDMMALKPTDPKYDGHYAFAEYLEKEFPSVFETLDHRMVNTHGHLYTWKGSKPDLKPILLMAHTDTVPVLEATRNQWTFPPFEGKISVNATKSTPGTWIWGRGSSDCKNSLMGILGAVEKLVQEGFKPERTILISNGFDEEIGGSQGAAVLSDEILKKYGRNGISLLIDEGFSGISEEYGSTVASLGMAEKGAMNLHIQVETLGGHSSVPPAHTGIGILALLLAELEANPYKPTLEPSAPYLKYLSCLSEYAPDLPSDLRKKIKNPKKWEKLAHELAASDRVLNSFLATTQAIDLINGGVKVNALPEVAEATVNHRISFTSSIAETKSHIEKVLKPLAKKLDFTISAFSDSANVTKSERHITLSLPPGVPLEPAPITPSNTKAFELMAGTCKTVFGEDVVVSPTGMFANTDTRTTWDLTENIYRFTPARITETLFQHTVDERISLAAHLNTTRFYYKLLRNSEGWDA